MKGYEQQLLIVTAGYFICMGMMILFFAMTAVFFFRFRIPETAVRMIGRNRTGAGRKKKRIREPSGREIIPPDKERDTVLLPEGTMQEDSVKEVTDSKTDDLKRSFQIIEQIAVVHSDEFI